MWKCENCVSVRVREAKDKKESAGDFNCDSGWFVRCPAASGRQQTIL